MGEFSLSPTPALPSRTTEPYEFSFSEKLHIGHIDGFKKFCILDLSLWIFLEYFSTNPFPSITMTLDDRGASASPSNK